MTDMGCNGFSLGMNLKRQRRYFFFNPNTDKTMIQTYQILPVVAIVCSASALAQNAADPVQMVKQNVDLISSANKVLDDVKDNAAVEIAIKQLNALTQQAKQLDKAMEKMKLTSEQAIRITKLNGDAQDTIVDMLENCGRIQKDKLMTPALLKAVNNFADAANIEVVETITTVEQIVED